MNRIKRLLLSSFAFLVAYAVIAGTLGYIIDQRIAAIVGFIAALIVGKLAFAHLEGRDLRARHFGQKLDRQWIR